MKNNLINMIYLFIIFGLIANQNVLNAHELFNIDMLRQFAVNSYDTMKSIYDTHSESSTPSTADIMEKMKDITASIDKWDTGLMEKMEAMNTLLLGLSSKEAFKDEVYNLSDYIRWIGIVYHNFRKYVEIPDSLSEDRARMLSEFYTSEDGTTVISNIRDMYSVIYPETWGSYKDSPFILIARETKEDANLCDVGNPQQRFLDYYPVIIVTEMKALSMTYFSYLFKSINEDVSYMDDMKMTGEEFMKRVEKYLLILQNALKATTRQFRSCDPPEGNTRDETFYEFERFMQNVVAEEITLTASGDCSDTCDDLGLTRIHRCSGIGCHGSTHVCQGSMRRCNSLNGEADFCEYPDDAPRRYQRIRDGWGSYHPDDTRKCDGKVHWPRGSRGWIYYCDICRCLCVEDAVSSGSTHFISLREQLSDVANNMVIVGLKFKIVNKMLHVDIQQGLLGNNATINEDEAEWKGVEDIQYDREGSIQSKSFKFYKDNEDGNREEMIEDKDVAVLTYDSRRIYLDTLTSPPNWLVTGIRFVRDVDESEKPIHLEIQATPFDYKTGILEPEDSYWFGPKDTSYGIRGEPRTEYEGEGFRNPEKSKNTLIDTKPNTFIDVDWSSWNEDASQTVIPFLDGRKVSSDPPTALVGVSLYHKKQAGYGGFLTFVLEGFNIALFIKNPRL